MDLITIIVPIYNSEQYLKSCIDSIIGQTYKKLQIVLVNDGSTDGSSKIINMYNDERIEIINKENGGLSDARNFGMKVAKGKFITFIDADDIISKNMIEILYKNIIDNNAQISECEYLRFCNENELIDTISELKKVNVLNSKLECKNILIGSKKSMVCGRLFLKELWNGIEFPVKKYFEDQFTFYKVLLKSNKIVEDKSKLYYYRRNIKSIVSIMNIRKINDFINATEEMTNAIINKYPEYKEQYINLNVINRLTCILTINKDEYEKNKDFFDNINNYIMENSLQVIKNKEISKVKRIKIKIYIFNNKIGKNIIKLEQYIRLKIELLNNIIKRMKIWNK